MIDKNTFGGGDAAETLAKILSDKYPHLRKKVSSRLCRFNRQLRLLHCGLGNLNCHKFLISMLEMYRDREMESIKRMWLPYDVESYCLNLMTKSFRLYYREINHGRNNTNKSKVDKTV